MPLTPGNGSAGGLGTGGPMYDGTPEFDLSTVDDLIVNN